MHRLVRLAVVTMLGALATAAGCGGGGGGQAGTGGGFTGLAGVGGFGAVDGGGPTDGGGGADGGADVRLDPAPPICGNGIVETGETCDGAAAAGCATGQVCGAACACVAGPPAPTDSGALIAAARAAGRIDYFTSLLYRAYRLAGDGRLPAEFDGDFTVDEDTALFLEVSRLWANLTPAQQQQLRPYVARPTDPASVYSTPPVAAMFGDSGEELLAAAGDGIACPVNPQTGEADWRPSEGAHFVVWACAGGDPAADTSLSKRQAAAAIADQVWALTTPSMGAPRPDDFPHGPGDRSRIDIYLVPLNRCITRSPGVCGELTSARTIAAAVPDSPCDASRGALTSSGFILMRADLTPDAAPAAGAATKARSDFAHEFFHILTYGLNLQAQGGACADKKYTGVTGTTSWLTEASATWAEWAYTAADNPDYREAQFSGYQKRIPSADSLLDNHLDRDDNPAYQAFVYPLFLSQEAGDRVRFENFWKSATAPRTSAALDDHLDSRIPFDPHFRDFAVRMFNTTLTPGDPIAPLLSTFDDAIPADFPPLNPAKEVMLPPLVTDWPFHVTLAPLAAQIQHFTIPASTNWVEFDVTGAGADLRVDAIVNVKGTWSRRRTNGQRFSFCREDAPDDVSELYLVLSNTGHAASAKIDKNYKVRTRVACPSSYTGWIRSERLVTSHIVFEGDTVDEYERLSETWTLGEERMLTTPVPAPAVDVSWSATYQTHDSTVTRLNGPCQSQPVLQTRDGSGSGMNMSQLVISEAPGGVVYLSPTGGATGMFNAPLTYYLETCDGITSTNVDDDNQIYEQLAALSTYLVLMPEAGNPGRYRGSHVVLHQETVRTGGSDFVDWVMTWDVVRNRR